MIIRTMVTDADDFTSAYQGLQGRGSIPSLFFYYLKFGQNLGVGSFRKNPSTKLTDSRKEVVPPNKKGPIGLKDHISLAFVHGDFLSAIMELLLDSSLAKTITSKRGSHRHGHMMRSNSAQLNLANITER